MNKKSILSIVVIVIALGLGVGMYFYYSPRSDNNVPVDQPTNTLSTTTITYTNTEYGFNFYLPADWRGYSIVRETWTGNPLKNTAPQSGPKLLIRNPKWTAAAPYEDLPILVLTIPQWNLYMAEDFAIGAAPIRATELARNNKYVFALPARWDFDYSIGVEEVQSIIAGSPIRAFDVSAAQGVSDRVQSLICNESQRYFSVEQSLADTVGSNILIKYKKDPTVVIPCTYKVEAGDFELKNVLAEYFLTLTDNFLVLDSGTAPEPRGLIVHDLRTRNKVFTDIYAKPVTVKGDSITYLSKTDQKPTIQNCPKLDEYSRNGLGAVIMKKVTVNLNTLQKTDAGEVRCVAIQ